MADNPEDWSAEKRAEYQALMARGRAEQEVRRTGTNAEKDDDNIVHFQRTGCIDRFAQRRAAKRPLELVPEHQRNAVTKAERLDSDRIQLIYDGNQLDKTASHAEDILIAQGAGIYQRDTELVRLIEGEFDLNKVRKVKTAQLLTINKSYLLTLLTRFIDWRRDGNKTAPPDRVASAILSRSGFWKFPKLAGVVMCPTLRSDWSISSEEGYDAKTQLYLSNPPKCPQSRMPRPEMRLCPLSRS